MYCVARLRFSQLATGLVSAVQVAAFALVARQVKITNSRHPAWHAIQHLDPVCTAVVVLAMF
jgi:hypothetical protein